MDDDSYYDPNILGFMMVYVSLYLLAYLDFLDLPKINMSALHYQWREEIAQIEHEDELRKRVIEMAIYKMAANMKLARPKGRGGQTGEVAELKSKINDYELLNNKLKQEHSTKIKLSEARTEMLREEVRRLKNQVLKLTAIQYATARDRLHHEPSIFSSPPAGINGIRDSHEVFTPFKTNDEFVRPQPRLKVQEQRPLPTGAPVGAPAGVLEGTPRRSLKGFDRSPNLMSPSPEFTPSRKNVYKLLKPEHKPSVNNKLHDVFADKAPKKKAKISLGLLLKNPKNKGANLGLEDDSLTLLNYYQDGNFLNEAESPPKSGQKRSAAEMTQAAVPAFQLGEPPLKKKNVFTID